MKSVHKALVVVHNVKYTRMVREARFRGRVERVFGQTKFLWTGLVKVNARLHQVFGYTHSFNVPPVNWSSQEEING